MFAPARKEVDLFPTKCQSQPFKLYTCHAWGGMGVGWVGGVLKYNLKKLKICQSCDRKCVSYC